MIKYKRQLHYDIKNAHKEKLEMESDCNNLSKNPDRWRLIRKRLKFWAMFRIFNQEVKTYGQTVYKHYYKDYNVRLDCMRNTDTKVEEIYRNHFLMYEDSRIRKVWSFIIMFLFFYTAIICPFKISVFEYSNTSEWMMVEDFISIYII